MSVKNSRIVMVFEQVEADYPDKSLEFQIEIASTRLFEAGYNYLAADIAEALAEQEREK